MRVSADAPRYLTRWKFVGVDGDGVYLRLVGEIGVDEHM